MNRRWKCIVGVLLWGATVLVTPSFAVVVSTNLFASESQMFDINSNEQHNWWGVGGNSFGGNASGFTRTLLRFDVPSDLARVDRAILHFTGWSGDPPNNSRFYPFYVSNDSWNAGTDWTTQPSSTNLLGFTGIYVTNHWTAPQMYSADVTGLFTLNPGTEGPGQTLSIMMIGWEAGGGYWYEFYARNGADNILAANANVYLELIAAPEPAALALLSLGGLLVWRRRT